MTTVPSRISCNPAAGRLPTLQFCQPAELHIDGAYQRDIETGPSKALIRKIAVHWNWDLCQPLVVARRTGDQLFVIDGQHRLAAARLRRDISQLPCVIVHYETPADEAASFVHLNQQRRPLSKLDLFRAAQASNDPEARAIATAIDAAGLSLATHTNHTAWKPGMVSNIGGIESCWRQFGAGPTAHALKAMAQGFSGQVLRYAGTIFPGIVAICAAAEHSFATDQERGDMLAEMLGAQDQVEWRSEILRARADDPNLNFSRASIKVLADAWAELLAAYLEDAA